MISQGAGGETLLPDEAARNVLDDLAANRPYTITHFVHTEPVEERFTALREAFELARRGRERTP